MASGPDHYREAERLAEKAEDVMNADYGWMASLSTDERLERRMAFLAEAQVHATLALAAATALRTTEGLLGSDWQAWYRAASEGPGEKRRAQEARAEEFAEEASS